MTRKSYIQIDGVLYDKSLPLPPGVGGTPVAGPAVLGDIPDFVSPIDGSVVSGRAGMREHCKRHNVVPTAELKGLPLKTFNQEHQSTPQYREETRRTIANIINSRSYK